jgi:hypothetical protein
VAKRFAAETKCDLPKCEICELAKAKRRPNKSETKTKNSERDGALKVNHLSPGTRVSVDHFECRQLEKRPPNNTQEGAYLLIMGLHVCMWNINLDFLLLKPSEQNNHMRECVLTMEYLCKII